MGWYSVSSTLLGCQCLQALRDFDSIVGVLLDAFAKLRKGTISIAESVCSLSTWNPTERIFIKFGA